MLPLRLQLPSSSSALSAEPELQVDLLFGDDVLSAPFFVAQLHDRKYILSLLKIYALSRVNNLAFLSSKQGIYPFGLMYNLNFSFSVYGTCILQNV